MNNLEFYVVYYLDRGRNVIPRRVTTINYLTQEEAQRKVDYLESNEPNLVDKPTIYEYRY